MNLFNSVESFRKDFLISCLRSFRRNGRLRQVVHKIWHFACERDFYVFEIICLRQFSSHPFFHNHTFKIKWLISVESSTRRVRNPRYRRYGRRIGRWSLSIVAWSELHTKITYKNYVTVSKKFIPYKLSKRP